MERVRGDGLGLFEMLRLDSVCGFLAIPRLVFLLFSRLARTYCRELVLGFFAGTVSLERELISGGVGNIPL